MAINFDYSKLVGRIIEKFGSRCEFSKALGISATSLSLKLNSKVPWTQEEIYSSCELLDIPAIEMNNYFFSIAS